MDCELPPARPHIPDDGRAAHIDHLLDDVQLAQALELLVIPGQSIDLIGVLPAHVLNVTQPVVDEPMTLVVQGRMEATLDSRVLEITPHGVFQGTIAVDNAEIHGRFEGELTVRKQLVIYGAGKVSGKIRYAKIKVEEGAELQGEISMLDKASAAVRKAA